MKKKTPRFKVHFLSALIFFEFLLAAALMGVLVLCYKKSSSPEAVVSAYCEGVARRDWGAVYDTLNVPKNATLTKQMFIDAKRNYTDEGLYYVEGYEETGDWDPSIESYESWYGDEPEMLAYDVSFGRTDGKKPISWRVTLVKSGKKYALFDQWKISPKQYIIRNTGFTVPKGVELTLNGKKVLIDEWAEGNWQSFGIEYLFAGDYQVEASMDGMKTYQEDLKLKESDGSYTIQLLPGSEGQAELLKQAKDDIQEILNAALTNRSFGTVSDLFASEDLKAGGIQNLYNELKKKGSNGDVGITWVTVQDLTGTISVREDAYYTDEENDMIARLHGTVVEKYIAKDGSSQLSNNEKTFEIDIEAEYTRTNGQWKLIKLPVTADMF